MATATQSEMGVNNDDEADSNALFERHTIDEIRGQEKKYRGNIERKKEDLRVMVGERYRDLIEAADTITEMKNSAENVMKSISTMETMCQQLKQNHMIKGVSFQQTAKPNKKKEEVEFYGVASQIKLLLDIPEKIWSSIDTEDYIRATQLFLLARHINTSLHLDTQKSSNILSWFPLLSRQWAAISHFKSSILQGCRNMLKECDSKVTVQKMAENLCSILLLEDSTPRQVFNEFLLARTKAVQYILHPNQQGNIKEQVCTVVQVLTNTIHQIYAVFYSTDTDKNNLLIQTIINVTTKSQEDFGLLDIHGSISSKCLPKSVKDFRPVLRNASSNISLQYLQDNCQQWITTCIQDISSGIGKLLNYVNTVKRLADIRDSVWTLLQQNENQSNWLTVCDAILDRKLNVWDDVLKPLFLDRVKALIKYQLDTTCELTKRNITRVMMELASYEDSGLLSELDLASYLWSESSNDILPNAVWTTSTTKTLTDSGGLILKAKAFTPAVQSLCESIDEKLKMLLEDNESYLYSENRSQRVIEGPFNIYQDTLTILRYVETSCINCIQEILNYLTEQLQNWQKALKQIEDNITLIITENKILVVARLCSAISELCPHLNKCVLGAAEFQTQESFSRTLKKTRSGPKVASDSGQWLTITKQLEKCKLLSYSIWVDYISNQIITKLSSPLHSQKWSDSVQNCTRWDEVNIQEETDEGKKLKSNIQIPMQASWYIQSMLYLLCRDINRVGGQALPRSIIQDLVYKVSDGIVDQFEVLVDRGKKSSQSNVPLTQQQALQALFNIKFIQQIIPRKDDNEASKKYQKRIETIIDKLEDVVDPFDLNVFTPYISSNLLKHTQRCSVIFGALTSLDKHGILSSGRTAMSSQQEQHNVLPLTSCPNRFPLLPLSTKENKQSFTQPVLSQTMTRSFDGNTTSLSSVVESTLPHPSQTTDMTSSLYDKLGSMSSRWFSNIGGKS